MSHLEGGGEISHAHGNTSGRSLSFIEFCALDTSRGCELAYSVSFIIIIIISYHFPYYCLVRNISPVYTRKENVNRCSAV